MTVLATKADYDGFAEQLAAIGRPVLVGHSASALGPLMPWASKPDVA